MTEDPMKSMQSDQEDMSLSGVDNASGQKVRSVPRKVLKWVGIALCVIIGLPLLLIIFLSLWLTPGRITKIVNEEGSKYLEADIKAKDVDFSVWSTFPRFKLTTGEVKINSRTLDNISPEIRSQLPDSASYLGSIRSFSGEINVVDLFLNRYVIHDVSIEGLSMNLVAYNDSINNYNIVPSGGAGFKKVPYISAEKVELKNPEALRYTSVETKTQASVDLKGISLVRHHGKGVEKNSYDLLVKGTISATSAGLTILNKFPFSLGGELHLRFDPFGVSLTDYSIDLGNMKSKLSMSVGIGDGPKIDSFDYRISNFSLMSLLGYVPKEFVPSLQGIEANVMVNASARMLSEWSFSSETLPSIEVDFNIPAGRIGYEVEVGTPGNRRLANYTLDHSPIKASFIFNGKEPSESYFRIHDFNVSAEGVSVGLNLLATRLTSRPLINADVNVNADVAPTLRLLPFAPPVKASGNIALQSKIAFTIADFTREGMEKGLSDIKVAADLRARNIHLDAENAGLKGNIRDLDLSINETSDELNSSGVLNPALTLKGNMSAVNLNFPGRRMLTAGNINIGSQTGYSGLLVPDNLKNGLPISVDGEVENVKFIDAESKMSLASSKICFTDKFSNFTPDPLTTLFSDGLKVTSPQVDLASGPNHLLMHGIQLGVRLAMRDPKDVAADLAALKNDSIKAAEIARKENTKQNIYFSGSALPHTPELIDFSAPQGLKDFLEQYAFDASVKIERADLRTRGFHQGNYFSDIDLTIDENKVNLRNLNLMLERTRANVKADIGNLRNFMLKPASIMNPLKGNLVVALDTVNINALARAYVESKGGMQNIPKHEKVTASDSVALMVPKNLLTSIRLSAKEVKYTNLNLSKVVADVSLKDGVVDIPALSLVSSFGGAGLNVVYDSRDINNMNLNLGLDIDKIDIIKFFRKFPSLIRMMPEMRNLSGTISANLKFGTDIFPDMYINMPSASAAAVVEGRGLTLKQSKFIRKITKMMLIETDAPIHIKDMNVHARIHDNLLQLDPFYFDFDRYSIRMLGVNNFNGRLYYHIGVEKSPIPFPFSVNIEGMFHHPKLRFGGGRYNTKKAEEVTSEIQEENNINMVLILRKLLRAFIGTAVEKNWD